MILSSQLRTTGSIVSHRAPVIRSYVREEVKRMKRITVRKLEDVRTSGTITAACEVV